MNLKFGQLPPGACFDWQGVRYVKINPLLARAQADGRERMVPRSAAVETVGDQPAPPPPPQNNETVPATRVSAALARLWTRCEALIAADGWDEAQRARLRQELGAALETARSEIRGESQPGGTPGA